jgi:site-specific DNA recombinase
LIDLYSEGLMDKRELEPRLRGAKERLAKLEAEAQTLAAEGAQQADLRLALTRLQDFAAQVQEGLEHADWATRRDVIRALVKRVEVSKREIRVVYRVAPVPFVESPCRGFLQHCPRGQRDMQFGKITKGRCSQTRFLGGNRVGKIISDTALQFLPREIGRDVVVKVFDI